MKCPRCGAETDEKSNYCQKCGAVLRQRDNSADDTLRLPDLSGVPLGGQPMRGEEADRRRESGGLRRDNAGPLKVTLVVCVLAIVIAVAVCLALMLTRRGDRSPLFEEKNDNTGDYQEDYGDRDYDVYDEPTDDEQDEPPELKDTTEPEAPLVEAEEHVPDAEGGDSPGDVDEPTGDGQDEPTAPEVTDEPEGNTDEPEGDTGEAGGNDESGAPEGGEPDEEVITPPDADEIPL